MEADAWAQLEYLWQRRDQLTPVEEEELWKLFRELVFS